MDLTEDLLVREELNQKIAKCKEYIDILNDYEAILFHKNIAKCQRQAYNRDRKDIELMKKSILIEIDFKQKITIGLSPRQLSKEYYNQDARSCLGRYCLK